MRFLRFPGLLAVFFAACSQSPGDIRISEAAFTLPAYSEIAILSRASVQETAGDLPAGKVPALFDAQGAQLPAQIDDLDSDGLWDELILDRSLLTADSYRLQWTDPTTATQPPVATAIHLAIRDSVSKTYTEVQREVRPASHHRQTGNYYYQMEGPAWENDRVGFRTYFDERNGMDIFGKRTHEMVLHGVGLGQNYHALQDWGMDVLKVGTSLGAGAIGMAIGDSLYPLGETDEEIFEILQEGPLRSTFTITHRGWHIADRTLEVQRLYTISKGMPGYHAEITLGGLEGGESLLTGIVNLHSDSLFVKKNGAFTILATHDKQAELNKYMGMAVVVPTASLLDYGETPEADSPITSTYYARMPAQNGVPATYDFLVGWEIENPDFSRREAFLDMLSTP